ncbi:MAG: TolC family protein [Verrucomicrobiaceae bacterium]|nr:TolC family protein [Verrucomicrobiaceae bacterium]
MIHTLRKLSSLLMTVLLVCAIDGCTSGHYSRSADRETLGILRRKSSHVPNSGRGLLDIKPPPPVTLDELAKNLKTEEFLGDRAVQVEKGAKVLELADALGYGVSRNREYLGRKETLYLQALDLTLTRHKYAPILASSGSAMVDRNQVEAGVNQFVTDTTQTFKGGVGLSMLSRIGTKIAADLTTDFTRFVTGGLREVSDSKLVTSISQPLLRGAGYLGASEVLTQDERSMLYAVRDFSQYRKTFTVDLAGQYYRALQSRDAARNAYVAYIAFKNTIERERSMQEANRRSLSSLIQLDQAVFTNQRKWLSAVASYEKELDDLKIQLGLPVTEKLMMDDKELRVLKLHDPPGTLDEAVQTALASRLDLCNGRDALEDANRKVRVAKQELLPVVDLLAKYTLTGDPGADGANLDGHRRKVSVGANVDLHLDRKKERNELRAAEVAEQAARRTLEQDEENVRRQIRADWRDLDLARKQYEIAVQNLALSEKRVDVEEDFFKEDKTTNPRDLIDARNQLIAARDLLTSTLVTHTVARLALWRDMGILFITKDGGWVDVLKKETPGGKTR